MSIRWFGCDLVSGQIVEELPALRATGTISRIVGTYTSATFGLPIPLGGPGKPPKNWLAATEPGRSLIVAVAGNAPIWAGIVLLRDGGTEATVDLSCVSIEGYLDRRYVEDHAWTNQDEASVIAAGLIGDANIEGIDLAIDAPATGHPRDRTYKARDNKTVYSALRELMGVQGGPEWTIDLGWSDSTGTGITKTVRVRSRIGVAASSPQAVFETTANSVFTSTGASEARYRYAQDYTSSRGANHIVAYSSGQGEDQPVGTPARDEQLLATGWPRWEYRFQPSTSISDIDILTAHAAGKLTLMRLGAKSIAVTARWSAYPALGTHWNIGDDVAWKLTGHLNPAGITGQGRVIGWALNPDTDLITPILHDTGEEVPA